MDETLKEVQREIWEMIDKNDTMVWQGLRAAIARIDMLEKQVAVFQEREEGKNGNQLCVCMD